MFSDEGGPGESFRGLILGLRGRLGLTQRDLAARLAVHPNSVQAWEAGASFPGVASLRALVEVAARDGAFTRGAEAAEALALWEAAMRDSSRLRTPFDRAWFAEVLGEGAQDGRAQPARLPAAPRAAQEGSNVEPASAPPRRQLWGEAPDTATFLGRSDERETLRHWALDDRCRVIGLVGLGGIGKTLLAARLAHDVAPSFAAVYWRSLRDGQTPAEWLAGALAFLIPDEPPIPGAAAQISRLLDVLGRMRCLLVLDNFETVMRPGAPAGAYTAGSEGYGSLLRQFGEVPHQSCIVLTTREAPREFGVMRGDHGPVRGLELTSMSVRDGRSLLDDKRLTGDDADWQALVTRCGGNGLALKMTGETIRDLFGGSISAYLEYAAATPGVLIGGVRQVIAAQIDRLSPMERELLRWLAVEREPVGFRDLAAAFASRAARGATLEAVEGLRRRSLVEHGERQASFTLHSVILDYVTEEVIEELASELMAGPLHRFLTMPLVKATARDYVRRSQERLIAGPLLDTLIVETGSREKAEQRLLTLLDGFRGRPADEQGYGPGNLANLLRLLRGDLRRIDLSNLELRQAFLQGVDAQDASLAGSHLQEVVLADAFRYPTAVTLSADGAYLAAGTSASEVCLWRVADRTLLATLQGHTGGIRGVAFSGDNRLAASASFDGTVRLWDVDGGRLVAVLRGHDGLVYAVALSADGRLAASGGQDGTVRLWDASDGRALATLPGHAGGVWGVALSGDGRLVASGSRDGTVRLWSAEDGRLLHALHGHTSGVLGVALSADGHLLASGSLDETVRLWDTTTGDLKMTLRGHTGGVRAVALSADGRCVASGSLDTTVRVWDTLSGRLLGNLRGHVGLVYTVALSGDGRLVASGSFDGAVKLWDTARGRLFANLQGYNRGIRCVAVSRDGGLVVSGGFDGAVRVWEAATGRLLHALHGHASGIRGVALSGDGRRVASGGFDGLIRLWDIASQRELVTLSGHTGGVWGLALSGDGHLAATGGYDGSIRLWAITDGRLVRTLAGHESGIRAVALSDDGQLLASGSEDMTVKLWDTASGRLLATLEGHTGGIWDVAVSGNGRTVASGSDDRTVRLWDAEAGRPLASLEGHTAPVWGVALSEDGGTVASASFDGDVRLWAADTGQTVSMMRGHDGRVVAVALDADGRVAASAGVDGTVRIWEPLGGGLLHTLLADRRYERMDITGLVGISEAQREALLALGAVEWEGRPSGDRNAP